MSCPYSTSEVYNEVNCFEREGSIQCPFADECGNTIAWDSIEKYIRKAITTYEKSKQLKEQMQKGAENDKEEPKAVGEYH